MIYGIGTDILDVGRMKALVERSGERFVSKVLGEQEVSEFQTRRARSEDRGWHYLATRWAAKEAFCKALGTGMREPVTWHTLQCLNDGLGKPVWRFDGALADYLARHRLKAHVSLSDETHYVVAFVILEQFAEADQ